jgi:hypothetical protein
LPGVRDDGTIDEERLRSWVRDARLALAESDRADIGDEEIGRVLAASHSGTDGIWPAEPVRSIIETIGSPSVEAGMHIGRLNDRGGTSRVSMTVDSRSMRWQISTRMGTGDHRKVAANEPHPERSRRELRTRGSPNGRASPDHR